MKIGHFIAIILFCLTIIFTGILYFDIQDGNISSKILFIPIFFTYFLIVFLIFPGSRLSTKTEIVFLENLTSNNLKAIIIGFALTIYFYFWAESLFTGEKFFTSGNQISLILSFGIIFFIIIWQINKSKKNHNVKNLIIFNKFLV